MSFYNSGLLTEDEEAEVAQDENNAGLPVPAETAGTAGATAATAEEYRDLAERLAQQVVQVRVTVRRYRKKVSLTGARTLLHGVELTEKDGVRSGYMPVLPYAWEKRFSLVEGRVRRPVRPPYCIRVLAYAWIPTADGGLDRQETPVSDSHVVSRAAADGIRQEVESIIREQWHPLVNELVDDWDNVVAQRRAEVRPEIWPLIEVKLPADKDSLRSAFRAFWLELPLGFRVDDLTVEALERGAADYLDALKESLVRQPLDALREAAGSLLEKLDGKTARLKSAHLEALRESLGAFRSFGDLLGGNADLETTFRQAEELLAGESVSSLNADNRTGDTGVALDLRQALSRMGKALDEMDRPAMSGGKFQRKIAL